MIVAWKVHGSVFFFQKSGTFVPDAKKKIDSSADRSIFFCEPYYPYFTSSTKKNHGNPWKFWKQHLNTPLIFFTLEPKKSPDSIGSNQACVLGFKMLLIFQWFCRGSFNPPPRKFMNIYLDNQNEATYEVGDRFSTSSVLAFLCNIPWFQNQHN